MRYVLFWLFLAGHLAQGQHTGEVKPHAGRPTLFVDGQPETPMFYALTHAYGGRWSWEEVPSRNIANFARAGIRLFQADLYLEDIWYKGQDSLDMAKVQRQVRGFTDVVPDARVVLRVHLNAPFWWNEAHPEECTEYADGPIQDSLRAGPPHNNEDFDPDRARRSSLASERWKTESGAKLVELCQRLARLPEGNAIIGMHLSGGIYGEWHYWGFIDHDPDTGPAMTRFFRNWLRQKYGTDAALQQAWQQPTATLQTATVPGVADRLRTDDGMFKDPTRQRYVLDYFTAQQQVVVDDMLYFCRLAKENWPRPLITGVFYGYLHMTFNRQTVGGHLDVERVMKSPYVDYLAGPQTYWEASRKAGGSGNSRGIIESTLRHGKLWLDELDNGYLHKETARDPVRHTERYDPVYENILHRATLLPLTRGIGLWFYDFGLAKSFGWWDNPKYLNAIRQQKAFFDSRLNVLYRSSADVLYVWSMDTYYDLKPAWTPLSMNVIDHSIEEALRSGAVGDHVFDFDLAQMDLAPYKAVVFMNVYRLTDAQRRLIREKVAQNGRTLVWNYLTGYSNGERLSADFVRSLTGIGLARTDVPAKAQQVTFQRNNATYAYKFQAPVAPYYVVNDPAAEPLARVDSTGAVVIARKQFKTHTSVFCALPLNGTAGFREVFRAAGCHIYNEQPDFTYANSGLLLLHSATGGPRTLTLRNGQRVNVALRSGATLLFDAETGQQVWPATQ